MDYKGRVFRLFVSSTFTDFQHERDALRRSVFPKIRVHCQAHGASFQPIDLRWGVSPEAATDQRTLRICLEEVERCRQVSPQLNFLALLGDRYGSQLLPESVPVDEAARVTKHLSAPTRALFDEWYVQDRNALPAALVLKPRVGRYLHREIWRAEVQDPLCEALGRAATDAGLPYDQLLKYIGSATHQEIYAGVLRHSSPSSALCFIRESAGQPPRFDDGKPQSPAALGLLDTLKVDLRRALPQGAVQRYPVHWQRNRPSPDDLDRFCSLVVAALMERIDAVLQASEEEDPLTLELEAQREFAEERRAGFKGREDIWSRIDQYVSSMDDHEQPLVLHGPGGSGKSAMLAYAAARVRAERRFTLVSDVYIGATPRSGTIRDVLETLSRQLVRSIQSDESKVGADLYNLALNFKRLLEDAGKRYRVILFIDALDQARDHVQSLSWLPMLLPNNVRIVVSTLPGPQLDALRARMRREKLRENLVEMPKLSASYAREVMSAWLADNGRTLQPRQMDTVIQAFEVTGSPLYLRMASVEASSWRSYAPAPALNPTLDGLVADVFARLGAPAEHGAALVSHSLGYLAAAFEGLAEEELLDTLSLDQEVKREVQERADPSLLTGWADPGRAERESIPPVLWARLYSDLSPYLSARYLNGMRLLGFYHRTLEDTATRLFLSSSMAPARHRTLADYFAAQPGAIGLPGEHRVNARRLDVLPYHLTEAGDWPRLAPVLSDIDFLLDKVQTGRTQRRSTLGVVTEVYAGVGALRDDYTRALAGLAHQPAALPPNETAVLEALERALRLDGASLSTFPGNLWPILYNRLQWGDEAIRAWLARAQPLRDALDATPWLRLESPTRESPALVATLRHTGAMDSCILDRTGDLIVVGSSAHRDRSITVWDRQSGQLRAILHDYTWGTELRGMTADNQWILVTGGSPAILLNLATGEWTDLPKDSTSDVWGAAVSPNGTFAVFAREAKDVTLLRLDGSGRSTRLLSQDRNTDDYLALDMHTTFCSCAISPSSRLVVVGMAYGERALFDVSGTAPRRLWKTSSFYPGQRNVAVAFAPDESYIVLAADDGRLAWVDTERGREMYTKNAHQGRTFSCAVSGDGRYVASGGSDARVVLWDARTGEQLRAFSGHTNAVLSCAFTPDSRFLVTAGDTSVRVWDTTIPEQPQQEGVVYQWRNIRQFLTGGRLAVATDHDDSIYVCDVASGEPITRLSWAPHVIKFDISPDNSYAVAVTSSEPNFCHTKVWEMKSGLTTNYLASGSAVRSVAISPGGEFAAMVGGTADDRDEQQDGLYDSRTWTLRVPLACERFSSVLTFTPDSAFLVATDRGSELLVFRSEDGAEVTPPHAPDSTVGTIYHCVMSPDGSRYVTVGNSRELRLWAAATLQNTLVRAPIEDNLGVPRGGGISFSPDGNLLAHATADGYLALWDCRAEAVTRLGEAPIGYLKSVSFSPDGAYLLTADADLVRLWDVRTRQQVFAQALPGTPESVAFHPWKPLALCNDTNNGYFAELVGITYGPLLVTAYQQNGGLSARCPKCQHRIALQRQQLGQTLQCSGKGCGMTLRINTFVITPHIPTWAQGYTAYSYESSGEQARAGATSDTGGTTGHVTRKQDSPRQLLGRLLPFKRREHA